VPRATRCLRMVLMKPAAPVLAMLALGMTPVAPLQNATAPTSATHESSARPDVEALIAQSGGDVSVAFRSLDGGQELLIQADRPFQDSLAMKIPVMVELFAQAAAQQLKLSDAVMVRNLFRSVVDSSAYTIDQNAGDSLENATGRLMTLGQLCDAMIKTNSDIAANLLIEHLTLEAIRDRIHLLGADGIVLASGFGDTKATDRGMKNVTTPRALMTILLALAQNNVVSADASAQMVGLLANSRLPGSIVGIAVSPSVVDSQRPSPGGDQHDAAIILGARSFVLVTDVRGISPGASAALVARISHTLAAAI
jgi:beta-lactamase class A